VRKRGGASGALFEQEERTGRVLDRRLAHKSERFVEYSNAMVERDVAEQVDAEFDQLAEYHVVGRVEFQHEMLLSEDGQQVANGGHGEVGADQQMVEDGERQHAIRPRPIEEGRPLPIHAADAGAWIREVHDHRGNGGGFGPEPAVHLFDRADVEIGGEDGRAAVGGDPRVIARVASDVEDRRGLGLHQEFADEGFLGGFGGLVVGAGMDIVAPDGCGGNGGGQGGDLLVEPPVGHLLGDGVSRRRFRRGRLAGLDLFLQGERQADVEDPRRAPALVPGERLPDLQRRTAVEVGEATGLPYVSAAWLASFFVPELTGCQDLQRTNPVQLENLFVARDKHFCRSVERGRHNRHISRIRQRHVAKGHGV